MTAVLPAGRFRLKIPSHEKMDGRQNGHRKKASGFSMSRRPHRDQAAGTSQRQLRVATIYVMPLGGRDEQEVLGALERNSRYVRGEIARRVNLKFAPEIKFRIDERFDEAERIEKLLRTPAVQRDLRSRNGK